MAYWDVSNPDKPFGKFDAEAILNFPFNWVAWLADIGSTYASHTITCPTPLRCITSSHSGGIITAQIAKAVAATPLVGTKYPVKCHIVAADGQEDERTVYLKIVER